MKTRKPVAIAIMGPTASGKSELAETLARRLGCRIVSADAFQVYRGLDIGTNKPADRSLYELLDVCDPWEEFSVGRFVELAGQIVEREFRLERDVVVCGGTGLYIRALFDGYRGLVPRPDDEIRKRLQKEYREMGPEALGKKYSVDMSDVPRQTLLNPRHFVRLVERKLLASEGTIQVPSIPRQIKFGLAMPRTVLHERISRRVDNMLHNGWLDEVSALRKRGARPDWPGMRAIGYGLLIEVLEGRKTLADAVERIKALTRQYAKRQMTWLRKELGVQFLDANRSALELSDKIVSIIDSIEGGRDGEGD